MGQTVHILLDIGLAFEFAAHRLQRLAESGQLRTVQPGQGDWLAATDGGGVILQPSQRAIQPPHHATTGQQGYAQQQEGGQLDLVLAAGNHRIHGAIGFADGQHAADPGEMAIVHFRVIL